MKDLQKALDNTDVVYTQLVEIAEDIIGSYVAEVNLLITEAVNNVNNITNDDIRDLIIKLSLKAYSFAEIKEKSALKFECAESLRKEAYAKEYNKAEGAVAARENTAIIETSGEIMTEAVYGLVSGLLKTKLDEIHRVVDSLKTVLMSRLSEAKLSSGMIGD